MDYLKIQNLFSNTGNFSLKNINLDIQNNEYFVLLGQSGSGKTMLLETIAGLNPCSGNIIFKGEDISLKMSMQARSMERLFTTWLTAVLELR